MRINKFLARASGLSRRQADQAIENDRVRVNDQPPDLGQDVDPETDTVTLDGEPVSLPPLRYLVFNKPTGYITSRTRQGRDPTIYDLLPDEYHELKPVGRLDKNSSGLLLLTNDGDLAHRLTHPSFEKTKKYHIRLDQALSNRHQAEIESGIKLEEGTSSMELEPLQNKRHWQATLREGKNRQIHRTFASLDYTVREIRRIQFAQLKLDELKLKPGEWQEVERDQITN